MKEQVKYVSKEGNSLLVAEKNGQVDEETVTGSSDLGQMALRDKYCSSNVCRRIGQVVTILALAACVAVIAVLLTNGIHASNSRELAQEEAIRDLKDKIDIMQTRLHRLQKELSFLVTRERAFDAKEESIRRRFLPNFPTISKIPDTEQLDVDQGANPAGSADSDLSIFPSLPLGIWDRDEETDLDKLPVASPNKRLRQGKGQDLFN